jgi:hypothetical protein
MTTEVSTEVLNPTEHTFTVPSGKKIVMRRGKGRDMVNAMRKARDTNEIQFALLAELITVEGNPIIYEDLLDMDLADVMMIQSESNDFLLQQTPKE